MFVDTKAIILNKISENARLGWKVKNIFCKQLKKRNQKFEWIPIWSMAPFPSLDLQLCVGGSLKSSGMESSDDIGNLRRAP